MQSFEITIDGQSHPGNFATLADAESAASTLRQAQPGKAILARPKAEMSPTPNDGLGTVQNVDPSKVLVQDDGIIRDQQGVVDGHGAAVPVRVGNPSVLPAAAPATAPNAAPTAPSVIPPKR